MALTLLREAVEAGAKETFGARWVAGDGGYALRSFVEGVRKLDLHTLGWLRREAVLRFPYTGPHERRPGRKRQFDRCFDRRDPARTAHTALKKEKADLYHGLLHAKAWQHFHFNIVFAALFWARLQARLRAERPLGPFSLCNLKRCNLEEEIHKRIAARSAAGRDTPIPKPAAIASRRNAYGSRTPSRNEASRPLNAAPAPARPYDSGLKLCPNHGHSFL